MSGLNYAQVLRDLLPLIFQEPLTMATGEQGALPAEVRVIPLDKIFIFELLR